MKSAWVVALVCVVLASGVFAQSLMGPSAIVSPRSLGMGGVGIGVADDGAAWFQNPAGLGALNLCPAEGKKMANDIIGNINDTGDSGFGLTWSGWNPEKKQGFGAGYFKSEISAGIEDVFSASLENKQFGVGYGAALKNSPFSWGVSVVRSKLDASIDILGEDFSGDDSSTMWNLGFMYQFVQPEKAPIRVGLTINDLTSETLAAKFDDDEDEIVSEEVGPFWNLGVAWPVAPQWLVAVDVTDITGEFEDGPFFSGGVEYCFADSPLKARAGLIDTGDGHDLTLGAGYTFGNQWRVDAAWANTDVDNTWSVGAGFNF